MEDIAKLDELPAVGRALKLPYVEYKQFADGVLKYKEYCINRLAEVIPKIFDWCEHLNCTSDFGSCSMLSMQEWQQLSQSTERFADYTSTSSHYNTSVPNILDKYVESRVLLLMRQVGFNDTSCYDDFICDQPNTALMNHYTLGIVCLMLCVLGLVTNLVMLPTYLVPPNRSGVIWYLTAMSIFDTVYLLLTTLVFVVCYMLPSFVDQMTIYAQISAYLIPVTMPIMLFCELLVVWLVLALLVNRLFYLTLGVSSKRTCSELESAKSISAVLIVTVAYTTCKGLEYNFLEYNASDLPVNQTIFGNLTIARVMYTKIGKSELFRNLMYHWLKVPFEMFLPYLTISIITSMVIINMLKLHNSRWKAVASLCNETACASVCRTGLCGRECRDGGTFTQAEQHEPPVKTVLDSTEREVEDADLWSENFSFCTIPPMVDETRENANVVVAVCIGFLLILHKLPKFLLHVLVTESYVANEPAMFRVVRQLLDTNFAACKPLICLFVGAHFRKAFSFTNAVCCCRTHQSLTLNPPTQGEVKATKNEEQEKITVLELQPLQGDTCGEEHETTNPKMTLPDVCAPQISQTIPC